MGDPFVQLRHELLSQHPYLRKYVAKNKLPHSLQEHVSTNQHSKKKIKTGLQRTVKDPEMYRSVPPRRVNNEEDVFSRNKKMYKRVQYGANKTFLIHRGLNPPAVYSIIMCPEQMEELENKSQLTMAAMEEKAKEVTKQKIKLAEESEGRRDTLRNMNTYQLGVVDHLVKQNRAKTKLQLKNADKASTDQQEEMRDFYGHVGSTQVLAMRELQIEDRKHFKNLGLESKDIHSQEQMKVDGPNDYEQMVAKRKEIKEKNMKIVSVLKSQALEREKQRGLEVKENIEHAERLDAAVEADLMKRMNERKEEEQKKQKHFDTFNTIAAYRDHLRGVRVAEDEALHQREKEFLEQKAKFNEAWQDKQNKIKAERQRLVSTVRADLSSVLEKQEQEEMEYYYTLQKERDIQMEDQEIKEKLNKKEAMADLMREWEKIKEENKIIKEQEARRAAEEKERMLKFLELENNAKKAEERKRMVEKDINRMEIMYQINERAQKRQAEHDEKMREIKLLKAEEYVREGRLRDRMLERLEDFKDNGLPGRFLSKIKNNFHL